MGPLSLAFASAMASAPMWPLASQVMPSTRYQASAVGNVTGAGVLLGGRFSTGGGYDCMPGVLSNDLSLSRSSKRVKLGMILTVGGPGGGVIEARAAPEGASAASARTDASRVRVETRRMGI